MGRYEGVTSEKYICVCTYTAISYVVSSERMKEVYSFHIDKPVKCRKQKWRIFAEKGGNYKAKMK